jgi:hypothetical protein
VKRYELDFTCGEQKPYMKESINGNYVRYSDASKILREAKFFLQAATSIIVPPPIVKRIKYFIKNNLKNI